MHAFVRLQVLTAVATAALVASAGAQTPEPPHRVIAAPHGVPRVAGIVPPPTPSAPFLEPGQSIFGTFPAIVTADGRVLVNFGEGYEQVERVCPYRHGYRCIYHHGSVLLVLPAHHRYRYPYHFEYPRYLEYRHFDRPSYDPPLYSAPVYRAPVYPSGGGYSYGAGYDGGYNVGIDIGRGSYDGYGVYGGGPGYGRSYSPPSGPCPFGAVSTGGAPACIDPLRAPVVNGYRPGPSAPMVANPPAPRPTFRGGVIVRP